MKKKEEENVRSAMKQLEKQRDRIKNEAKRWNNLLNLFEFFNVRSGKNYYELR